MGKEKNKELKYSIYEKGANNVLSDCRKNRPVRLAQISILKLRASCGVVDRPTENLSVLTFS